MKIILKKKASADTDVYPFVEVTLTGKVWYKYWFTTWLGNNKGWKQ